MKNPIPNENFPLELSKALLQTNPPGKPILWTERWVGLEKRHNEFFELEKKTTHELEL
jgi:hypothetical protein